MTTAVASQPLTFKMPETSVARELPLTDATVSLTFEQVREHLSPIQLRRPNIRRADFGTLGKN